jgi:hypothetical protein
MIECSPFRNYILYMNSYSKVLWSLLIFSALFAKTMEAKEICSNIKDCLEKSEKTNIHRKKIRYYDEAINGQKSAKKNDLIVIVYLLRANSVIREAQGDTGYKGEIALKVTHKPEYIKSQYQKAKLDLIKVTSDVELLTPEYRALYLELNQILEKESVE